MRREVTWGHLMHITFEFGIILASSVELGELRGFRKFRKWGPWGPKNPSFEQKEYIPDSFGSFLAIKHTTSLATRDKFGTQKGWSGAIFHDLEIC